MPGRFNSAYGLPAAEIIPYVEQHSLIPTTLVGSEGVAAALQENLMHMRKSHPDLSLSAFEIILETASDPSMLGLGNHVLYIERTPA